jgi:hypothetical protein
VGATNEVQGRQNEARLSSEVRSNVQRHGWDFSAAALLLYAAYLLAHVANHYYVYRGFGYGWMRYEEGAYFERLRLVVCAAWILAALRFYNFKLWPIALLGVLIAWLFNPIIPVTMSRLRWQPYDHWTLLLSLIAAPVLVALSYSTRLPRHPDSTPEPPS